MTLIILGLILFITGIVLRRRVPAFSSYSSYLRTGGLLLFAPDWQALRWDRATGPLGLELWGSGMPETYLTHGTPLVADAAIA